MNSRIAILLAAGAGVMFTASALRPGPPSKAPLMRAAADRREIPELLVDSAPPREDTELLFFEGRPMVAGPGERRVVVTESGTVLAGGSTREMRPLSLRLGGKAPLTAAPGDSGTWWVSTMDGELVKFDRQGDAIVTASAPFGATALSSDPVTGGLIASRSPERFGFLPESPASPLIVVLDRSGQTQEARGRLVVPEHSLLAGVSNAGYATAAGDTVFFAPLSRGEIVALGPRGDTLWRSPPPDGPPTPEPRFRLADGRVRIEYQPLNLALTLGPDGRLYVLRAADTGLSRARLDVIDRGSGRLLWRATLPGLRPTLAANRLGRVYRLAPDGLVGATPPDRREALPGFDLPRLGGGRVSLASLAGRVVLLNVWASWCQPCRTEMPALDSLRQSLEGSGFVLLALSEDQKRKDAERFVTDLGLKLEVLFGDGRLRQQLGYPGLPYTLMLDEHGRIVRRWIGQLGAADLELIRMLVRRETSAPLGSSSSSRTHEHRQPTPPAG